MRRAKDTAREVKCANLVEWRSLREIEVRVNTVRRAEHSKSESDDVRCLTARIDLIDLQIGRFLFAYLFISRCTSVYLYMPICLFDCLFGCLSVCLPVCLCVCVSACLSVCIKRDNLTSCVFSASLSNALVVKPNHFDSPVARWVCAMDCPMSRFN